MHPASITILGGGTAGWMAACLLQHHWPDCRVTVIESKAIGIVGVGEGSTPQLKHFFETIGVSEAEWMPAAHATYKHGIAFEGWSADPRYDRYFHPFPSALDVHTVHDFFRATQLRRSGLDVQAHPDAFLLPGWLANAKRGPESDADWPFETSYGYHFDAHEVGQVLKRVATGRGVEWRDTTIGRVEVADGAVTALVGEDGERHTADFFLDASGFRAMIIEQALGVGHLAFANNLFNDRAVVMPTNVADGGPGCATRAVAMEAGWRWSIPLTHRTGNGYVYSSHYLEPAAAEAELRAALGAGDDVEARHLEMRCGRVAKSWAGNCLAIGLAQGFLEPLEATALHLVLATVERFIERVDEGGLRSETRAAFNTEIAERYEGIRDYIVAHYRLQTRRDTQYWRDCASHDELSVTLKQLMTAWFTGRDLDGTVRQLKIADYYNAVSWHCLFAGYGNFPADRRLRAAGVNDPTIDMDRIERFLDACETHYRSHDEMLAELEKGA
ncbi:tryptophan halogenase family protein [Sphingomicrobium sp. XHP0235]|uniref:tryptophan halogenase family protein n=1 Tax=Sphingomicrobium aquimarinum TaxID=3133971 RepID=UPI0031FF248F